MPTVTGYPDGASLTRPDPGDRHLHPVGRTSTTSDAARVVGIAATTLQKYAQQGRVPFNLTPGGHRRFDPAEVAAALRSPPTLPGFREIVECWLLSIPMRCDPCHMSGFGSVAPATNGLTDSDIARQGRAMGRPATSGR